MPTCQAYQNLYFKVDRRFQVIINKVVRIKITKCTSSIDDELRCKMVLGTACFIGNSGEQRGRVHLCIVCRIAEREREEESARGRMRALIARFQHRHRCCATHVMLFFVSVLDASLSRRSRDKFPCSGDPNRVRIRLFWVLFFL